MLLVDITYAALLEAGRPDLANLVQFFEDDDGSLYLEPMDEVSDLDLIVMSKAVFLAQCAVDQHHMSS